MFGLSGADAVAAKSGFGSSRLLELWGGRDADGTFGLEPIARLAHITTKETGAGR